MSCNQSTGEIKEECRLSGSTGIVTSMPPQSNKKELARIHALIYADKTDDALLMTYSMTSPSERRKAQKVYFKEIEKEGEVTVADVWVQLQYDHPDDALELARQMTSVEERNFAEELLSSELKGKHDSENQKRYDNPYNKETHAESWKAYDDGYYD